MSSMGLYSRLQQLEEDGRPIRVGIVGAGDFGTGIICQTSQMKGIEVTITADVDVQSALSAYQLCGLKEEDIAIVDSLSKAKVAMDRGKRVIVEDASILTQCPIDVVVDVTGVPAVGAFVAYHSILNGKDVVMVNVEADVLVGPILKRLADSAGVVYTLADGDQPSLIKGLYDWAKTLAFQIIVAGKGMREDISPESFQPTKNQIEMASVANMTGLVPDVRGMHRPSIAVPEVPQVFSLKENGGILNRSGVVDFVNCLSEDGKTVVEPHLANGVFLVVASEHPQTLKIMSGKGIFMSENGKNGIIYRPHHLCGVEAPISIAKAAILKQPTGAPIREPVAEVIAIAKRDLKTGERIVSQYGDEGSNIVGLIERFEVAKEEHLLPAGLADGVKMRVDARKGTPITYGMLQGAGTSFSWKLRELQDAQTP